ncbi:putative pilin structural protein SafD [Serratia ficaria]|uniref:AfaD family invasin n=1 Tax=Serratia ficaria TaxID=61651 RepID=UPI00217AA360|nr:AfaD family invasin [Serratia ficaria]CAI2091861.1 putative pilin structural protein SafD [Serratia ficaria]CAI2463473.1 putative pilin structural protein SafD [Serratia ficaria]
MMKAVITGLMAVWLSLSASGAQAGTNGIDLKLSMRPINERQLNDGQIIGSGQVAYQGEHRGFQVWLTAEKQNGAAERYILRGSNNNTHRMFVRLERPEWIPDDIGKQGIIIYTGEARADFNIVIDGDQEVAADSYRVPAQVGAITS